MTEHICPFAEQSSTPATHGVMDDIKAIILHDTEGWRTYDMEIFTTGKRGDDVVSIQFYVLEDGTIYQFMPANVGAWHAGSSMLPDGTTDVNQHTIGIELEHGPIASRVYPEVQLAALDGLIAWLDGDVGVKPIYGHKQIAPDRKSDPNGPFPLDNYQRYRRHAPTATGGTEVIDSKLFCVNDADAAKMAHLRALLDTSRFKDSTRQPDPHTIEFESRNTALTTANGILRQVSPAKVRTYDVPTGTWKTGGAYRY